MDLVLGIEGFVAHAVISLTYSIVRTGVHAIGNYQHRKMIAAAPHPKLLDHPHTKPPPLKDKKLGAQEMKHYTQNASLMNELSRVLETRGGPLH